MTLRLGGDGAITGCTSLENPDLTVSGLTISGSFDAEKVLVASGTAAAPSYTFSGDTDNGLYYAGTNSIGLSTGGTNAILIDSAGNVGIGTTSPGKLLSIQDSTAPSLALYTGSTIRAELKGTTALTTLLSYSNSPITFNIGGSAETEAVRIDGSGRVLIGTTTEGYAAYADNLTIADSGNCGMTIRSGTSNQGNIYFSDGTSGSDEYEGIIQYLHNDDAMAFGVNNGSERMRIDSSGNVGIGKTPADTNGYTRALDLSGTTGSALYLRNATGATNYGVVGYYNSDLFFSNIVSGGNVRFYNSGSERLRIASTGQVLIGTTSPSTSSVTTRISAYSSTDNWMLMDIGSQDSSSNTGGIYGVRSRSSSHNPIALASAFESTTAAVCYFGGGWGGFGRSANELRFYTSAGLDNAAGTSGNQRMTIDSSGNVGIGTGSPLNPLHIANQYPFIRLQSNSGSYQGRNMLGQYDHVLYLEVDNDDVISDSAFAIKLDNQEALRIHHNGRLQNYSTDVNGGAFRSSQNSSGSANIVAGYHSATSTSNGTTAFYFLTNGGLANYQSNDSNLCDEREKKNIVSLDAKWDKVKSWELKKFHYNEDADTDDLRYGVIAQQIEEHCPEVLTNWQKQKAEDAVLDEDGNVVTPAKEEIIRKGVKEQQMMWMAIKALQEAMERIETLEAEVAELKNN